MLLFFRKNRNNKKIGLWKDGFRKDMTLKSCSCFFCKACVLICWNQCGGISIPSDFSTFCSWMKLLLTVTNGPPKSRYPLFSGYILYESEIRIWIQAYFPLSNLQGWCCLAHLCTKHNQKEPTFVAHLERVGKTPLPRILTTLEKINECPSPKRYYIYIYFTWEIIYIFQASIFDWGDMFVFFGGILQHTPRIFAHLIATIPRWPTLKLASRPVACW